MTKTGGEWGTVGHAWANMSGTRCSWLSNLLLESPLLAFPAKTVRDREEEEAWDAERVRGRR